MATIVLFCCVCINVATFLHATLKFVSAESRLHADKTRVYLSSCMCPEMAAKTRIALIKAHGLQIVRSLQSSAKQTSSCMQKWLKEHNLAEMKR